MLPPVLGLSAVAAFAQTNVDHYAEFCRFTSRAPTAFLCTPVVNYTAGGLLFADYYSIHAALTPGRADMQQFLVDVDGDGKPDYCRFIGDPAPVLTCAMRSDAGFADHAFTSVSFDLGHNDKPRFVVDIDGDGKPDFCRFTGPASGAALSCALQSEGTFGLRMLNSVLDPGQADKPRFMVDVNGDGKADYCRFVGSPAAPTLSCTLATADGFAGDVNSAPGIDLGHADLGRFMADVNGDGKADFCRFVDAAPSTKLSCLLSDGTAFGTRTHESQPLLPESGIGSTQGVDPGLPGLAGFMVDVNRDRKADFCRFVRNARGVSFFSCAIATRRGFGNYDINAGMIAPRTPGIDPFDPGRDDFPRLLAPSH
jgi:hypothetical protein